MSQYDVDAQSWYLLELSAFKSQVSLDLVEIEFLSEDENTIFAQCQITFILCGTNCFKCDPDSSFCLVCENEYSFKDTIEWQDCHKTSDNSILYIEYYIYYSLPVLRYSILYYLL